MTFPLTAILDIGSKVLDRVIPDPAAKAAAQLELLKLSQTGELAVLTAETDLAKGQIDINKIEAASENPMKSGWRPAIGWICAAGLAYQLVVRPLLGWATTNLWQWSAPPPLEFDTLMTLLFGMLGLGAYRTAEKLKGAV